MVVVAEYIWLGGNSELRSKTKVLHNLELNCDSVVELNQLPDWNYDGSSTGQASGDDSEVIIKPKFVCPCPFRRSSGILVLCDTYKPSDEPLSNNHRVKANDIFEKNKGEEPWYGIEQEFFIHDNRLYPNRVLGFISDELKGGPRKQGQYYCSVGANNAFGRELLEEHLENCIYAKLQISGINAEVAPGQWEYQIGPCLGINSGDQLWISRYILMRTGEKYDYTINFHPKPLSGDWNGSGCHTNYSTKSTREGCGDKSGLDIMYEHMERLKVKHEEHMKVYGLDNHLRMTGKHETASFYKFSYGVADRGSSVRIGNDVYKNKCGYYEDRRPSSNMDPYLVTSKIFETTVLE